MGVQGERLWVLGSQKEATEGSVCGPERGLGGCVSHCISAQGLGLCRNSTVSLASPHKLGLQTRTIGKGNPLPLSQALYIALCSLILPETLIAEHCRELKPR